MVASAVPARAVKERPIIFSAPEVRALLDGRRTQTRRIVKPQPPSVEDVRAKAGDRYHLSDSGRPGMWRVMGAVWAVRELMSGARVDATARADVGPQWRCPYGARGDRLWVRETFYCDDYQYPDGPRADLLEAMEYRADHDCTTWEAGCPCSDEEGRSMWRSPMFMPRWGSRILLEITDVRVQRVQEINEQDARAEGVRELPLQEGEPGAWWTIDVSAGADLHGCDPVAAFRKAWGHVNGNRRRKESVSLGDPRHRYDRPYTTVRDESVTWAANPWVWALTFKCTEEQQ